MLNRCARPLRPALITILCAALIAAAPPIRIHRFAQVNEHVYRGAQPAPEDLESLAAIGVKAVIDLRAGGDARSAEEKKQVVALGMKYYRVPMSAVGAPGNEQVAAALALIEDSENWPVFVHCKHGKDRTGTVVACYRIQHDHWQNRRALVEAQEHGLSGVERGMRSYILHFQPVIRSASLQPSGR